MHIIENDLSADSSKCKRRVYCISCLKFIECEMRNDPRSGYPVVHHDDVRVHRVIFATDIRRLLELGTSRIGQSTRYETAEMYCIPVEKLEQILANVVGDL